MFFQDVNKIVNGSFAIKDFPFAVNYVFLQIKGGRFRNAEVFKLIQICYSQLIAGPEKMISCVATGQYNRSKISDIDFILPKILGRNSFHVYEWPEINFQVKLFC